MQHFLDFEIADFEESSWDKQFQGSFLPKLCSILHHHIRNHNIYHHPVFLGGTLRSCLPPATWLMSPALISALSCLVSISYFLVLMCHVSQQENFKPLNSSLSQFFFLQMTISGFTLAKCMVDGVMTNRPVQKQE